MIIRYKSQYDHIVDTLPKYETFHQMTFYEGCAKNLGEQTLCYYCRMHDKKKHNEPSDKCTNGRCWEENERVLKRGRPDEEEQISLF